jgi:branched-chain amino acid transport system substrate-binding protein
MYNSFLPDARTVKRCSLSLKTGRLGHTHNGPQSNPRERRAENPVDTFFDRPLNRRGFLAAMGAAGVATAAGCTGGLQDTSSGGGQTIRIGYVSPKTGPLAVFGESNDYVLGTIRKAIGSGLEIGGKKYPVEIIEKDMESNSSRAAQVAGDLINSSGVDLILCTSTPDTTNPVSDQCEAARVPCIATICPWEIWFYPRGGNANKSFSYTYLYFIGTEQEAQTFTKLWSRVPGGHVVGGLWPNDVDGEIFRRYVTAEAQKASWRVVDSGAYQDGSQDFTSIISSFKSNGVDIVQATPIPPDIITFVRQASQNRLRPKLMSVAKALLFPSVAEALGPLVTNIVSPVWWNPAVPYTSSLDGTTAKAFADGYQTSTGKQWTQPMGFNYAIFEIAIAALKKAGDPKNKDAVAKAIGELKGEAITGSYDFTAGPVKNVAMAPDTLGQWRPNPNASGKYDLLVVDNTNNPKMPIQADLQLMR